MDIYNAYFDTFNYFINIIYNIGSNIGDKMLVNLKLNTLDINKIYIKTVLNNQITLQLLKEYLLHIDNPRTFTEIQPIYYFL